MTALAAALLRSNVNEASPQMFSVPVAVASQVYAGGLVAVGMRSHGTAAKQGTAFPFTGAAHEQLVGIAKNSALGAATTPRPAVEVAAAGAVWRGAAISGLAGDATDVWRIVYASDDNALTLTRPTRGVPVGVIEAWVSSTVADVRIFNVDTLMSLALSGNGRTILNLGSVDLDSITTANCRTAFPMPYAGRVVAFFAMVDVAPTGAGGTADFNLEIDGTNVTGGVVTVATGDAKGAYKAGTAITAANKFSEGSTIDIEAVVGTDMTAGRADFFAVIELGPGL
jgi:hypothetical protein